MSRREKEKKPNQTAVEAGWKKLQQFGPRGGDGSPEYEAMVSAYTRAWNMMEALGSAAPTAETAADFYVSHMHKLKSMRQHSDEGYALAEKIVHAVSPFLPERVGRANILSTYHQGDLSAEEQEGVMLSYAETIRNGKLDAYMQKAVEELQKHAAHRETAE